jgi:hypothetical protein
MTTSEILLAVATVGGFVLLLLTLGAFVIKRQGLGLVLLIGAGAAFVAALVLMGRVSTEQDLRLRAAVLDKYDVKVQQWGQPLGSDQTWKVDHRTMDCHADVADESDPVLTCNGREMPLR